MPDQINMSRAEVQSVTMTLVCECGADTQHEVDFDSDDFGWVVPVEERFILCEVCDCVIDAGFTLAFHPIEDAP